MMTELISRIGDLKGSPRVLLDDAVCRWTAFSEQLPEQMQENSVRDCSRLARKSHDVLKMCFERRPTKVYSYVTCMRCVTVIFAELQVCWIWFWWMLSYWGECYMGFVGQLCTESRLANSCGFVICSFFCVLRSVLHSFLSFNCKKNRRKVVTMHCLLNSFNGKLIKIVHKYTIQNRHV